MFCSCPKSHFTFRILCKKICHQELSKIAQTGHTGSNSPALKKNSRIRSYKMAQLTWWYKTVQLTWSYKTVQFIADTCRYLCTFRASSLNSNIKMKLCQRSNCFFLIPIFKNMGQSWHLFRLFPSFSHANIKYSFNDTSWNEHQPRGRRMVEADETKKLWRPPPT